MLLISCFGVKVGSYVSRLFAIQITRTSHDNPDRNIILPLDMCSVVISYRSTVSQHLDLQQSKCYHKDEAFFAFGILRLKRQCFPDIPKLDTSKLRENQHHGKSTS